jgi:hypothetical protein
MPSFTATLGSTDGVIDLGHLNGSRVRLGFAGGRAET